MSPICLRGRSAAKPCLIYRVFSRPICPQVSLLVIFTVVALPSNRGLCGCQGIRSQSLLALSPWFDPPRKDKFGSDSHNGERRTT
jgi:hypothetical protein